MTARLTVPIEVDDGPFRKVQRSFTQQYAGVYFCRLAQLRPAVEKEAMRRWGSGADAVPIVERVLDLKVHQRCILIGTLYKEMPLKPSILEEYTNAENVDSAVTRSSFVSDEDLAILEDSAGRVRLTGSLPVHELATGIIIAVMGHELHGGEFHVSEYCLPGMPPIARLVPPPSTIPAPAQAGSSGAAPGGYVCLVSGLQCGQTSPLQLECLLSYLCGELGTADERRFAAEIACVIVAGNTVAPAADTTGAAAYRNMLSFRHTEPSREATQMADTLLARLAHSVPVHLMPGATDPANHMLPQQPFAPCMLPHSMALSSLQAVCNPHRCTVAGVQLLGTAGQPVDDLVRYTRLPALAALRLTLSARHMAPTAPDTLSCYPFYETDPFVLSESPHVYFAGCQREFATEMVSGRDGQRVRLVLVPSFAETGTIVLVNLGTLDCHPVTFRTGL